jgi:hypothetical protein
MIMQAEEKKIYTPEEYLNLEVGSERRHEYIHGEIVPMTSTVYRSSNTLRPTVNTGYFRCITISRKRYLSTRFPSRLRSQIFTTKLSLSR